MSHAIDLKRCAHESDKHNPLQKPSSYILILGCSQTKLKSSKPLPALCLYDGVNFRVLRKYLREYGWPTGLLVEILSAKYGLLDATHFIDFYDLRMSPSLANQHRKQVLSQLQALPSPASVFVNLGKHYRLGIEGLAALWPTCRVHYAEGSIGKRMQQMKRWLQRIPNKSVTLRGESTRKSYYYFFPDWDDYVIEPFKTEASTGNRSQLSATRKYPHELMPGSQTPYDGVLVSLAQLHASKGSLSRVKTNAQSVNLRQEMRIPAELVLFGDCGAFSYASEDLPPFSSEQAAFLYDRFGFDGGASVDHIPLPEVTFRDDEGNLIRQPLAEQERKRRIDLTVKNAEEFLTLHRSRGYTFAPFGVAQGIDTASYVSSVQAYLDMGYQHIAIGGLVPKPDYEVLQICCGVRKAIQMRPARVRSNTWLHLFGILRPKLQPMLRNLGISSFDSASYFRKAWLRSDQNYISPDGQGWYGTIRVPLGNSKRMREAALKKGISATELALREQVCLQALRDFDGTPRTRDRVLEALDNYGPLLQRKGEDNHFHERHQMLLKNEPWKHCGCPICRSIGMDVVVFRGAGRNKRRGLHNTWVFYHKLMPKC